MIIVQLRKFYVVQYKVDPMWVIFPQHWSHKEWAHIYIAPLLHIYRRFV